MLVAHSTGQAAALRAAELQSDRVSDAGGVRRIALCETINGVRTHYVTSGLPTPHAMLELPQLLRTIGIELLEAA